MKIWEPGSAEYKLLDEGVLIRQPSGREEGVGEFQNGERPLRVPHREFAHVWIHDYVYKQAEEFARAAVEEQRFGEL